MLDRACSSNCLHVFWNPMKIQQVKPMDSGFWPISLDESLVTCLKLDLDYIQRTHANDVQKRPFAQMLKHTHESTCCRWNQQCHLRISVSSQYISTMLQCSLRLLQVAILQWVFCSAKWATDVPVQGSAWLCIWKMSSVLCKECRWAVERSQTLKPREAKTHCLKDRRHWIESLPDVVAPQCLWSPANMG